MKIDFRDELLSFTCLNKNSEFGPRIIGDLTFCLIEKVSLKGGDRMARASKFTKSDLYESDEGAFIAAWICRLSLWFASGGIKNNQGSFIKYYDNKDELITEYMAYEMERFLQDLEKIKDFPHFKEQLAYLLRGYF